MTCRSVTGGAYFDKGKGRLVRYYVSDHRCAGYYRRLANRAVRRAGRKPDLIVTKVKQKFAMLRF